MHRVAGAVLAIVIGLMGSSGCARSVPRDDAAASIGEGPSEFWSGRSVRGNVSVAKWTRMPFGKFSGG